MSSLLKFALTSIIGIVVTSGAALAATNPYPSSFDRPDPIEEIQQMRERMKQRMQDFNGRHAFHNLSATPYTEKFGEPADNDILKREDNSFVYYDVKVDSKNTAVKTKIQDGYITVTGTSENSSEVNEANRTARSQSNSAFSNTFMLPKNVDANKMEMVYEKDKVILKFPKINS
jgi:HSP20 family molecular chaperone IbpA